MSNRALGEIQVTVIYNELKRPAACEAGDEALARTIGIVSLSHTRQNSSHIPYLQRSVSA